MIKYVREDQWTKYYQIGTTRIIFGENGNADILHKICPRCGNMIVLTFYESGVYISGYKDGYNTQIPVSPENVIYCEKCVKY